MMHDRIRDIVAAHAGLPVSIDEVADDTDLYRAGMKSFASVQLMLALEEGFDIEFPEELMTRATFRSISALAAAIGALAPGAMAA